MVTVVAAFIFYTFICFVEGVSDDEHGFVEIDGHGSTDALLHSDGGPGGLDADDKTLMRPLTLMDALDADEVKTLKRQELDEAMAELKVAGARMSLATGKPNMVNAVKKVEFAIEQVVSKGVNEFTCIEIQKLRSEIKRSAEAYSFDPDNLPSTSNLRSSSKLALKEAKRAVYSADRYRLSAAIEAGKVAGLNEADLQDANTALQDIIMQPCTLIQPCKKRELSEVMAELKLARSGIKFVKGKPDKVEAVNKLNALHKEAVSMGGNKSGDTAHKYWIDKAGERIQRTAEKYNFDPESPPSDEELESEKELARNEIQNAVSSGDFEQLLASSKAGEKAGLSKSELQQADTAVETIIKQRQAMIRLRKAIMAAEDADLSGHNLPELVEALKVALQSENDELAEFPEGVEVLAKGRKRYEKLQKKIKTYVDLSKPKNTAVVSQLSGFVTCAICVIASAAVN